MLGVSGNFQAVWTIPSAPVKGRLAERLMRSVQPRLIQAREKEYTQTQGQKLTSAKTTKMIVQKVQLRFGLQYDKS